MTVSKAKLYRTAVIAEDVEDYKIGREHNMARNLQLWHIGSNKDGEETVLQSSPFGQELQEFRLQPDEGVMVRDPDKGDLLVVVCRQTVATEELVNTLERLTKLVTDLMPGVAHIALPDYALLNDAPREARRLIARLKA